MRAEYLVASRELCQELYAVAGDKVETYFCWWVYGGRIGKGHLRATHKKHYPQDAKYCTVIPAYDSVVLGRLLPPGKTSQCKTVIGLYRIDERDGGHTGISIVDKSEPNARICMLLYLLKEGIVKAKDLG